MPSSFPVFFLYLISACTDGFQTHITSFFQTTGDTHCNLSKNPSSLNRYVWVFSMWQKSINQEKIPFPSVLESRKKPCQLTSYLPIQYLFKDTRGKRTGNQECITKSRQALSWIKSICKFVFDWETCTGCVRPQQGAESSYDKWAYMLLNSN